MQIILTPIETARDLIKGRCEALRKELSSTSPNTKTLQIVLQGSVLLRMPLSFFALNPPLTPSWAEVNAGPVEICRVFLAQDKRKEWPEEQVKELELEMKKFFKLCGFALV